ncbi:unnamed protein product [Polarella glacialis]|uniref:C3H1-type domain-containing protein n=2 Tax=Polarella glacialis TaxID=89957 RepID=A0A813EZG3_POLGL|nr:unnamed protein product [Polarella glacialis]
MKPCKFHSAGNCKKGAECPFAHPSDGAPAALTPELVLFVETLLQERGPLDLGILSQEVRGLKRSQLLAFFDLERQDCEGGGKWRVSLKGDSGDGPSFGERRAPVPAQRSSAMLAPRAQPFFPFPAPHLLASRVVAPRVVAPRVASEQHGAPIAQASVCGGKGISTGALAWGKGGKGYSFVSHEGTRAAMPKQPGLPIISPLAARPMPKQPGFGVPRVPSAVVRPMPKQRGFGRIAPAAAWQVQAVDSAGQLSPGMTVEAPEDLETVDFYYERLDALLHGHDEAAAGVSTLYAVRGLITELDKELVGPQLKAAVAARLGAHPWCKQDGQIIRYAPNSQRIAITRARSEGQRLKSKEENKSAASHGAGALVAAEPQVVPPEAAESGELPHGVKRERETASIA